MQSWRSWIAYHLHRILEADTGESIVIRIFDTDVFILLLYHVANHTSNSTVWMDTGLKSNNTGIYINISQPVSHMDRNTINTLPDLHAFTGSDYTAAFMGKGKLMALQLIMKSDNNSSRFTRLHWLWLHRRIHGQRQVDGPAVDHEIWQ